jgi:hypothetical protein
MSTSKYFAAAGFAVSTLILTACADTTEPSHAVGEVSQANYPASPDAAMKYIADELAGGNGGVLWDAMPATYRSDVAQLVQLAGAKIDGELYDQVFNIVGRIGELIGSKQEFLLNSELGASSDPEQRQMMEQALPVLATFLETITSSSIATSAGLKSFDGQVFFDTTVSGLLENIEALSSLQGENSEFTLSDFEDLVFSVVDSDETTATLRATVPGEEPIEESYVKIEDRWVPTALSAQWSETIATAMAELEAITAEQLLANKPQAQMILGMVEGVLHQLEGAATQQQFDQALQGAMMPLMGLMMMGQGMGAPEVPPSAPSFTPTLPGPGSIQ